MGKRDVGLRSLFQGQRMWPQASESADPRGPDCFMVGKQGISTLGRFQCHTAFQEGPGEAFGALTERFRQLRELSPVLKIDRGPSKLMVHSSEP